MRSRTPLLPIIGVIVYPPNITWRNPSEFAAEREAVIDVRDGNRARLDVELAAAEAKVKLAQNEVSAIKKQIEQIEDAVAVWSSPVKVNDVVVSHYGHKFFRVEEVFASETRQIGICIRPCNRKTGQLLVNKRGEWFWGPEGIGKLLNSYTLAGRVEEKPNEL